MEARTPVRTPPRSPARTPANNAGHNPYAVSSASFQQRDAGPVGTAEAWRDGKLLVMRTGGALPDRCVKCNEDCDPPKKPFRVHWHHWSVYLLLLIAVPVYVIVGMLVRRKAEVPAGLCDKHRNRRKTALIVMWLVFVGGILASAASSNIGVLIGIFAALLAILIGLPLSRVVWARHIDAEYVRLKGCGPEFLASLPPFRG